MTCKKNLTENKSKILHMSCFLSSTRHSCHANTGNSCLKTINKYLQHTCFEASMLFHEERPSNMENVTEEPVKPATRISQIKPNFIDRTNNRSYLQMYMRIEDW